MNEVLIFDTETTGIKEPELIEAAYVVMEGPPNNYTARSNFEQMYRPSKPIELGALSTHHIMDEDLMGCPPSSEFKLPEGVQYLIGHNVDYDWMVIGKPEVKRICTLALCRSLWPELDAHRQSAMMYHLERSTARERLANAHRAMDDVYNCLTILKHIIASCGDVDSWEELWQISEAARIPTVMPFGKHKGERIADVPASYVSWLLKQPDVDPYLVKALTK